MDATFTRETITSGSTRVPEVTTGNIFTPNLPDGRRVMLLLSDEDLEAFVSLSRGPSDETVEVEDLLVGETFVVRRANCGAGCFCAAEIVVDR